MIGLILYFVIGYIVGLAYYTYECRNYKKNKNYLTWNQFDDKFGVTFALFICTLFWPVVLLAIIVFLVIVFPAEYIKKYYGIK